MLLHIVHDTRYAYTPPVETAQHMAHLKPRQTATQQLLRHTLTVEPAPAQQTEALDVYGNTRSFFSLQSVHDELLVRADSVVSTRAPAPPASSPPWEQVRERFRYHAGAAYDGAAEFVFASPCAPRHEAFAAYARPSFGAGVPLLLAAHDLMERIHGDFTYESQSTEVSTPALEALAQRKGVCQDFAHIMVACLRAMGLSARYVSGYLLTEPPPGQPRLIGSDASHAWASVYVPGAEGGSGVWCDFDPTNNRAPGEDYVTLATGRDFSDVSPVRGVIHGGARHTLDVAVTVQPLAQPLAQARPTI
ncbi:transglutaminase family protein [Variovorax terrae]|uniref:Transglutaminase family protein n=1 Tax=Variovorax terrae TaxID=2923278 RepID=A0A9X1VRV8_9BURK|nr:transglutaminase family protein [Variovorax terrae]MCJ0762691.1 transglutaminase family protein [Variovorax terrae]